MTKKPSKNFKTRTLTGVALIIIMVGATVISKYTYGVMFAILTVVASMEYMRITGMDKISATKRWILILVNLAVFLLGFGISIGLLPKAFRIFGILPMFLLFSGGLFGTGAPNYKLSSTLIAGHVYIGIPLMLLSYVYLHNNDFWPSYVLAILIFVWTNDSGAYFVGSQIGKTKLLPAVSPKKTWEGFFGGFFMTVIAGYLFSFLSSNLTPLQWMFFGAMVSVGSTFGDLIASSLKRTFGVKDSGRFFPGHGGIIDRFDGFFIAIVFVFTYLAALGVIV